MIGAFYFMQVLGTLIKENAEINQSINKKKTSAVDGRKTVEEISVLEIEDRRRSDSLFSSISSPESD